MACATNGTIANHSPVVFANGESKSCASERHIIQSTAPLARCLQPPNYWKSPRPLAVLSSALNGSGTALSTHDAGEPLPFRVMIAVYASRQDVRFPFESRCWPSRDVVFGDLMVVVRAAYSTVPPSPARRAPASARCHHRPRPARMVALCSAHVVCRVALGFAPHARGTHAEFRLPRLDRDRAAPNSASAPRRRGEAPRA